MDVNRHRTHKRPLNDVADQNTEKDDSFKTLLEDSARVAYSRPWHRIERGLRLNRLRLFVEENAEEHVMSKDDKEKFFLFLQKSLDKKLLNTLKVVNYDQDTQRITKINGLEIKRNSDGGFVWGFSTKKVKTVGTRKKKLDEKLPGDKSHIESKIETPIAQ